MDVFPVIMAGGTGTRFWPASRVSMPKQFLKILGPKTMLELTVDRLGSLCPASHIIIVGSRKHHALLAPYQTKWGMVVFEEPIGRNTAPCIGLAAAYLRKKGMPDAPMIVLPADHYIANADRFSAILLAGCTLAKAGAIITVGIVPTRPETGYGYLHQGPLVKKVNGFPAYRVERFVEKPDFHSALCYLEAGEYLWNGGIFIFTARTFLEETATNLPDVYDGLVEIEAALETDRFPEVLETAYEALPSISIDYGIMEKTSRTVMTVPGDFGWSDVGSWESLYDLRRAEADQGGNLASGTTLLFNTKECLVFNETAQMVVTVGIEGAVIVNTEDALLVANIRKSQEIKKVLEKLEARGGQSLL